MRNLKKFLALVLALMMVMSVMVTVSAKTSYTDDDKIDANYSEAIEVLSKIGVLQGRGEAGSSAFDPEGTLTRAEAAKIVSYMLLGSDAASLPTAAVYSDVPTTFWGNKFVNYASLKEIIDPANDKFRPGDKVTGYEFGKMVLVAAGFDPDEYTNTNLWYVNVAEDVKLTAGDFPLNTGDLSSSPITREAAAQLAFAILNYAVGDTYYTVYLDTDTDGEVDTGEKVLYTGTDYSLAMLYAQSTGAVVKAEPQTLGSDVFGLTCKKDATDVWGRPVKKWTATAPKATAEFPYPAVAKYTVAIDECEVVEDHSELSGKTVVSYWKNGVEQTNPAYFSKGYDTTIEAQGVNEVLGAQGTQIEIYAVTGGYRVVEIETWLAKVSAVTPATVDKNGHATKRTVTLTVYDRDGNATIAGYESDTLVAGDYVLVTAKKGATAAAVTDVVEVKAAPQVTTGAVTTWSTGAYPVVNQHTIGGQKYNDAEKFSLGYHVSAPSRIALGDGFGNVIGLVDTIAQYVVVEKIAWIHNGLSDGVAKANLIKTDGTRVENVTISKINGAAATNTEIAGGSVANAQVTDDWSTNTAYYTDLMTYTVDAQGNYTLAPHPTGSPFSDDNRLPAPGGESVGIITGAADIWQDTDNNYVKDAGETKVYGVGTDNTVYILRDPTTGKIDIYTGKNNVPTLTKADVCILNNADGYAALVLVTGAYTKAGGNTGTFVAYVGDYANSVGSSGNNDVYQVYPVGSTEARNVLAPRPLPNVWNSSVTASGMYQIVVNDQGVVTAVTNLSVGITGYVAAKQVGTTTTWLVNTGVKAVENGSSLKTQQYSGSVAAGNVALVPGGTEMNFAIRSDAAIMVAYTNGVVAKGTVADLAANDAVIVAYETIAGQNYANAIYVIKAAGSIPTPPSTTKYTLTATASYSDPTITVTAILSAEAGKNFGTDDTVTFTATLKRVYQTGAKEIVATKTFTSLAAGVDRLAIGAGNNLNITCGTLSGSYQYELVVTAAHSNGTSYDQTIQITG